jgi:hypothetical protein
MLARGDNLVLTSNLLQWLGESRRTTVLMVDHRSVILPLDPQQIDIELPPPTAAEVKAVLRQLPAELLIDFGNQAARAIEDSGAADDFLSFVQQKLPMHVVVSTLTVLLGLLATFRLFSGVASGAGSTAGVRATPCQLTRDQRQQAARALLNNWRKQVGGSTDIRWSSFARNLHQVGNIWQTYRIRREVIHWARRVTRRSPRYWTPRRLQKLHERTRIWQQMLASGTLVYRSHKKGDWTLPTVDSSNRNHRP